MAIKDRNQLVLDIESALARAQARLGIIPQWAADEITRKADISYVPTEELAQEMDIVQHRMVALLNIWSKSMENGAEEFVHFGTTTVDIYDTVKVLQLRQAVIDSVDMLRQIECSLISLAKNHRSTPMIGRTLGQHALPITFGKKVSTWLGTNRRNIERLKDLFKRLDKAAILKGAVGTYLGLGEKGLDLEALFAKELGMQDPYIDDWHGSRDIFAEYAMVMSLVSKALGHMGTEIFLLQTTDLGEVAECRIKTAVGSSALPHKLNPQKSEALIHYARKIPRLAEVILDDMINFYERDDTSRNNELLDDIASECRKMLEDARYLIEHLHINEKAMTDNMDKTNGFILSQRIAQALAPKVGLKTAESQMHGLIRMAKEQKLSLHSAVKMNEDIMKNLGEKKIDDLFDLTTYTGLAKDQVDEIVSYIEEKRKSDLFC